MNLIYEVKRHRFSVTQGSAEVYLNGKLVISFADEIEIGGQYGENINGWGSTRSDEVFIKGVMFPFCANKEPIEKRVKEILNLDD